MGTRKIVVGEGGGKAGTGATAGATVARAAACLPLQCPPNIMMLSCDVSNTGRGAEVEQRTGPRRGGTAAERRGS